MVTCSCKGVRTGLVSSAFISVTVAKRVKKNRNFIINIKLGTGFWTGLTSRSIAQSGLDEAAILQLALVAGDNFLIRSEAILLRNGAKHKPLDHPALSFLDRISEFTEWQGR
jgi:hypothetical protein